jgi:hypothetical protein
MRKMNNETLIKCICHKGFRGYSCIVVRLNTWVGGKEITSQSLRHMHSSDMTYFYNSKIISSTGEEFV